MAEHAEVRDREFYLLSLWNGTGSRAMVSRLIYTHVNVLVVVPEPWPASMISSMSGPRCLLGEELSGDVHI